MPFLEAARLLYEGPWVAERYAALKDFFDTQADKIFSPVRDIIAGASRFSAADAFAGQYRLRELKREADRVWDTIDCLVTPTAGTIYPIATMQVDPIQLNSNLGYYTNFMNLLDYSATAVPTGFQNDGLPFGITLLAPAHQDGPLLHLAARMQAAVALPLGATNLPQPEHATVNILPSGQVQVAVVGAHLSGLPLNGQLTSRMGRLIRSTCTTPCYRLYALPDGKRPGLIRVEEGGAAIKCEVWELPASEFGSFVAGIPAPLGIGKLELVDGGTVNGFICESIGITGAVDITGFGGWQAYLQQKADDRS